MQVIGVNRTNSANEVKVERFIADTGATFPFGYDLSESYAMLRDAAAIGSSPQSAHVIIDRDGNVAYLSRIYDPDVEEQSFTPVLDALIAAQ